MDELLIAIQNAANTIATPNWADIMGVCLSLLAVIVACFVAWRQNEILIKQIKISMKQNEISKKQASIADKQNRIALFEKRLEIYDILFSCKSSASALRDIEKNEDILEHLFYKLSKNPQKRRNFNRREATLYLLNCCSKLKNATFFFSEEIGSYITTVSSNLILLICAEDVVDSPKEYNEIKQSYLEAIKLLEKYDCFIKIQKEIKLI